MDVEICEKKKTTKPFSWLEESEPVVKRGSKHLLHAQMCRSGIILPLFNGWIVNRGKSKMSGSGEEFPMELKPQPHLKSWDSGLIQEYRKGIGSSN